MATQLCKRCAGKYYSQLRASTCFTLDTRWAKDASSTGGRVYVVGGGHYSLFSLSLTLSLSHTHTYTFSLSLSLSLSLCQIQIQKKLYWHDHNVLQYCQSIWVGCIICDYIHNTIHFLSLSLSLSLFLSLPVSMIVDNTNTYTDDVFHVMLDYMYFC